MPVEIVDILHPAFKNFFAPQRTLNLKSHALLDVHLHHVLVTHLSMATPIIAALDLDLSEYILKRLVDTLELKLVAKWTFLLLQLVQTLRAKEVILALAARHRLVNKTQANRATELVLLLHHHAAIYMLLLGRLIHPHRFVYLVFELLLHRHWLLSRHYSKFNIEIIINSIVFLK